MARPGIEPVPLTIESDALPTALLGPGKNIEGNASVSSDRTLTYASRETAAADIQ